MKPSTLDLGREAAALLRKEYNLRPASFLVEMHVPGEGIRYVSYARNYQGFVVQRCYQGTGQPQYYEHESFALAEQFDSCVPYWQPILNPLAVAQAGLDPAAILGWAAANPGDIFRHPTYAPLCLRWKSNICGITLTVPADEVYADDTVYFTPHTCQLTGKTYYQYIDHRDYGGEVARTLHMRAGLALHEHQLGAEGSWSGYYGTDRIHLETALGALGYRFELAQRQILHYTVACFSKKEIDYLTFYDFPEQALAHFTRLPRLYDSLLDSLPVPPIHPLGQVGRVELLNGKVVCEQIVARKALDWQRYNLIRDWCADGINEQIANSQPLSRLNLPTSDIPVPQLIPTLHSLLAAAGYPHQIWADRMDCTEATILQWEKNPQSMSLQEIHRLSTWLGITGPALVALLDRESLARDELSVGRSPNAN